MKRYSRQAASLLLVVISPILFAQDPPPRGEAQREVIPPNSPLQLAITIPSRLDPALSKDPVEVQEKETAALQASAVDWMREALAPLADPKCRAILERVNRTPSLDDLLAKAGSIWDARPVAAVSGGRLGVPRALPPLVPEDRDFFRSSGLLPFEIGLAGEWVRAAGTLHAGPPPADPLLRAARASRLEGVARLAGLIVVAKGAGADPVSLGTGLLAIDQNRSGWPRQSLLEGAKDPLVRAAMRTFLEDGVRWALFHFLRGGWDGLNSALERPGEGPEGLLRPGLRRGTTGLPEGCRVGPRVAAVLLTGDDDPDWVDRLMGDSFSSPPSRGLLSALVFEDAVTAEQVATELAGEGWKVRVEGNRIMALGLVPSETSEPPPEKGDLQRINPP